jgi:hypothetical protein
MKKLLHCISREIKYERIYCEESMGEIKFLISVLFMKRVSDAGQQTKELKPGKEKKPKRRRKPKKRREESREMQNLQFSLIINNPLTFRKVGYLY